VFPGEGPSNVSMVLETAIFGVFAGYVFGPFRDKVKIIDSYCQQRRCSVGSLVFAK